MVHRLFILMILVLLIAAVIHAAQSDPQSAVTTQAVESVQIEKSVGILLQVVRNVETHVNGKDLASVHNEDMMMYSAISTLLEDARRASDAEKDAREAALLTLSRQIADLHEAADANNQADAETRLAVVLISFADLKKLYPQTLLSKAQELADQYTCPMHPDITGKKTDACPKCGMELDQNIRINLYGSGQTISTPVTMKASVQTTGPLTPGTESTFYLRLRKIDGSPVLPADLREVHTEKIHLLIIDPGLQDYHHVHPKPTDKPGIYSFTFTPAKKGTYRSWADVRSALTGLQEYVMTDIPDTIDGEPLSDKSLTLDAKSEGLRYQLSLTPKEIKAGQPVSGKLRITQFDGAPFTQLEPLMGAFAHIVAFNEDYKTVLHVHPKGPKLVNPTDRGGPELEFVLYATKPGFYRVFAQIQVEDKSKFASFGLNVAP